MIQVPSKQESLVVQSNDEAFRNKQSVGLAADFAGHIVSAAHRRFNFAVSVRTFRNGYLSTGSGSNHIVNKFFAAVAAGHRADAHAAFVASIGCHVLSSG